MVHSNDVRCGAGSWDVNINCFYDYLDSLDEELIVRDAPTQEEKEFRNSELEDKVEDAVTEYINWKVFGDESSYCAPDNRPPSAFGPFSACDTGGGVWAYVYFQVCRFITWRSSWYELRSTLDEDKDALYQQNRQVIVEKIEAVKAEAKEQWPKYIGTIVDCPASRAMEREGRRALEEERAAAVQAARTGGRAVRASLYRQCKKY